MVALRAHGDLEATRCAADRDFDRSRFARPAENIDDGGDCQNCRIPAGDGVRVRVLKDYAFHMVGTEKERAELDRGIAQLTVAEARAAGLPGVA